MAKTVSAIHELHKSAAVAELCRARWQVAEKHKLGRVTKHIKIRTRHKIVVTERMLAKTGIPTGMQTHPVALPTRDKLSALWKRGRGAKMQLSNT